MRVHSTSTRDVVAEFRRGADSANINWWVRGPCPSLSIHLCSPSLCLFLCSLCFSLDSEFLLCSSDKATVHIFAIKDQTLNKKSRYSSLVWLPNVHCTCTCISGKYVYIVFYSCLPFPSLSAVGLLSRAVSSYTESQWGLAQFSLPKEGQCVCAFSGSKSVVGQLKNSNSTMSCSSLSVGKYCVSLQPAFFH